MVINGVYAYKATLFSPQNLIFSVVLTGTHEMQAQIHGQDFGLITVHGFNGFSFW